MALGILTDLLLGSKGGGLFGGGGGGILGGLLGGLTSFSDDDYGLGMDIISGFGPKNTDVLGSMAKANQGGGLLSSLLLEDAVKQSDRGNPLLGNVLMGLGEVLMRPDPGKQAGKVARAQLAARRDHAKENYRRVTAPSLRPKGMGG